MSLKKWLAAAALAAVVAVSGGLPQAHSQSAMQAHRTGQGTGRTTTKKLSIRVARVRVAVTMHAPLSTVGVQVAFAEVPLATNTGCTIVPAPQARTSRGKETRASLMAHSGSPPYHRQ